MKKIAIIVGIIVVGGLYVVTAYNGLVRSKESVTSQWAQVESQYQRRFDLIPNLVESVKGVMKQEEKIFGDLADARARYAGATTLDEKAQAAGAVETGLGRLLAIMENYPTLKSSETVQTLMAQLEGTENRVSVERMRYNEAVKSYNLKIRVFPRSIIAGIFNFETLSYFESETGAENAPQVNLTE